MTRVLFVCGRNRLRSPTAEKIFGAQPNIEVQSAGLDNDADEPLTPELVQWADIIFVMEKPHGAKLAKRFRAHLGKARVICLDIADRYEYMDPTLIGLLRARVSRHLPDRQGPHLQILTLTKLIFLRTSACIAAWQRNPFLAIPGEPVRARRGTQVFQRSLQRAVHSLRVDCSDSDADRPRSRLGATPALRRGRLAGMTGIENICMPSPHLAHRVSRSPAGFYAEP